MTVVRITQNGRTEAGRVLQAFQGLPGRAGLKRLIGESIADMWSQHLYEKDRTEPNRLGGKRTHYWRVAGDSVATKNTARGVIVSATQIGIRKKVTGGMITPKRAKALTIPIHRDAYGKRAREFGNLFIVGSKDDRAQGKGLLARDKSGGGIEPMYVLRRKVVIKKDPSTLPSEKNMRRTIVAASRTYLIRNGAKAV